MLLDNPVDGVQPQSGALALRLGGEEGFEDATLNFWRNAGAVIADFDENVIWLGRRANPQVALAVHRVDRVDDQVGPDLIERAAVSGNARQVVGVFADHRYAALQLMAEYDERVLQSLMHVHLLQGGAVHVRILFDRAHQVGDSRHTVLDLPDQFLRGPGGFEPLQRVVKRLAFQTSRQLFQLLLMQSGAHESRREFPAVGNLMRFQPIADLFFAFA